MSDHPEISEKGQQERFARWEEIGVDRIKHDLLNGTYQALEGTPQGRELAATRGHQGSAG
jgi:hypothetical protein